MCAQDIFLLNGKNGIAVLNEVTGASHLPRQKITALNININYILCYMLVLSEGVQFPCGHPIVNIFQQFMVVTRT